MCQIDENILKNEIDAFISVSLDIIRPGLGTTDMEKQNIDFFKNMLCCY